MRFLLTIMLFFAYINADFLRAHIGANMLKINSSQTTYKAWGYIKHFVPIVPNLRISHQSTINSNLSTGIFNNIRKSTINDTDIIAYYNLLDNLFWITLDLGAGASFNNFQIKNYDALGFARARIEIPTTQIGLEMIVKQSVLHLSKPSDITLKADIQIVDLSVIDFAIEAGYQVKSYYLKNITSAIKRDNYFIGVVGRF